MKLGDFALWQAKVGNSRYDQVVKKHFQLMGEYAKIVKGTAAKPFVSRIRVWSNEDIEEFRTKRVSKEFVPFAFRDQALPRLGRKTRLYLEPAREEQSRRVFLIRPLLRRHVRSHILNVLQRLRTIYAAELAATDSSTKRGTKRKADLEMLINSIEAFTGKSAPVYAKRRWRDG